jgi:lactosylceramide 4-alpha-galactosyltransferase
MESTFMHNPNALLTLYIKEGIEEENVATSFVNRLKSDGYMINVIFYNFRDLISKSASFVNVQYLEKFLMKLPEHEKGEFWAYSHESNIVRLLILIFDDHRQFDGIYVDSDIIITKTFNGGNFHNNIAYEGSNEGRQQSRKTTIMNNNVLIFEPGHPFLIAVLEEMLTNYNPKVFSANGPVLLTRVYRDLEKKNVTWLPDVLSADTFQPIDWFDWNKIWDQPMNSSEIVKYQMLIKKESYAVHLNNRLTRELKLKSGTLVHYILTTNCIYCEFETN